MTRRKIEISKRRIPINTLYTRKHSPIEVNRITKVTIRYNIVHSREIKKNTDLL